jgi:hypothetical protein
MSYPLNSIIITKDANRLKAVDLHMADVVIEVKGEARIIKDRNGAVKKHDPNVYWTVGDGTRKFTDFDEARKLAEVIQGTTKCHNAQTPPSSGSICHHQICHHQLEYNWGSCTKPKDHYGMHGNAIRNWRNG